MIETKAKRTPDKSFETTPLPPFESDRPSRILCIIGLAATCILSFVSISVSIPVFVHQKGFFNNNRPILNSNAAKEIVALILNICVTVCTEVLGFIHATSLRWALYHEGRLCLNSNLRLFTNARQCAANSWYTNCIWALLVTVSYSTASQVILPTGSMGSMHSYVLNSQALAILGVAFLLQAMLAFWCIAPSRSRRILSWNSSPLNTALALLHKGGIQHTARPPTAPHRRQIHARRASTSVGIITVCLWALLPIIIAWGVAMWFVSIRMNGVPDKSFDPENDSSGVYPSSATAGLNSSNRIWKYQTLLGLAIVTAMQLIYTLALHAAEQIVNLARDEVVWRRASNLSESSSGAAISLGSLKAALTTWQTLALLALKPVSHWLFGLSAVTFSYGYLAFNPVPIFCLAVMSLVLAVLVTFLGFTRPKGPQPAAWGDLKKLAEFVDDWGEGAGGRLYWGDKGLADSPGIRLAGTSPLRQGVSDIRMEGVLYKGLGEVEER